MSERIRVVSASYNVQKDVLIIFVHLHALRVVELLCELVVQLVYYHHLVLVLLQV